MNNRRYANSENRDRDNDRPGYRSGTNPQNSGEKNYQNRESGFRSGGGDSNSRPRNFRSRDSFRSQDNPRSGNGGYNPRENRFQPRDGSQNRDRTGGYRRNFEGGETGDSRSPGFRSREGYKERDNRFQSRDNRFQSRDDRFQTGDNRFQNRESRDTENRRFDSRRRPDTNLRRRNVEPRKVQPPKPKIISDLQITDGKHIGKFLKNTESPAVKATSRKLREVMMRILSRKIRAKRFLDLFAGAGMVGFEAISRGALLGTFVERSAKMVSLIKKNRDAVGIKDGHAEVFEIEVIPFLKRMEKRRRQWDVVFLDPPYDANYDEILQYLSRGVCIKPKGVLVIEHPDEMFFPEKTGSLKRVKVVSDGETSLSFYERQ